MLKNQACGFRPYTSALLFAFAMATGAVGGGCSGSVTQGGSGPTDGGGAGDGTGAGCTPADCAGLAAPAIAMLCPDGSSVGATLCTRQSSGQCDWGFPACPADDGGSVCPGLGCAPQCPNGVLKDVNGCDTCSCVPALDAGDTGPCTTDADCSGGRICGFLESAGCAASGQCFPGPTGPTCAIASSVGCGCGGTDVAIAPSCVSGLPTGYQTKPVLHEGACSDGGACVSPQGGHCGGNTAHPCTCASGLNCTPGDGGLPFGDVGGTCQ